MHKKRFQVVAEGRKRVFFVEDTQHRIDLGMPRKACSMHFQNSEPATKIAEILNEEWERFIQEPVQP